MYKPIHGMEIDGRYFIKVNFPNSERNESFGRGEGMWVIVDEQTCRDYDDDVSGVKRKGILDNDSIYYPGLNHGTEVEFEMRGDSRPVASYKWLVENYGECQW